MSGESLHLSLRRALGFGYTTSLLKKVSRRPDSSQALFPLELAPPVED